MALEWVVLSTAAAAAAEASLLLLLTVPFLAPVRRSGAAAAAAHAAMKPLLAVVPFCLFLLLDICWKYEVHPVCDKARSCGPAELVHYEKTIAKSQRNVVLVASALLLYWLLFAVTRLVVRLQQLEQRIDKLRNED